MPLPSTRSPANPPRSIVFAAQAVSRDQLAGYVIKVLANQFHATAETWSRKLGREHGRTDALIAQVGWLAIDRLYALWFIVSFLRSSSAHNGSNFTRRTGERYFPDKSVFLVN